MTGRVILLECGMHEAVPTRCTLEEEAGVQAHGYQEVGDFRDDVWLWVIWVPGEPMHLAPFGPQDLIHFLLRRQSRVLVVVEPMGQAAQQRIQILVFHEGGLGHPLRQAPRARQCVSRELVELDASMWQACTGVVYQCQDGEQQRTAREMSHAF